MQGKPQVHPEQQGCKDRWSGGDERSDGVAATADEADE